MEDKSLKIITLTSWKKRLTNLPIVLDTIFNQTMKPDKIVLNLSEEEFPKKEKEIPEDVLKYLKSHKEIEIYWVPGKNTKQWKKIIPTLKRYPNDWVICIDDDIKYVSNFIETLWKKHLEYPNNPITMNRGYFVKGYLQHCGCGTLECARFYNNFNGIDFDEIMSRTESSDTVYNYLAHKCGYPFIPTDKILTGKSFNQENALSKTSGTATPSKHVEIWNWLIDKYGKIENKQPQPKATTTNNITITKPKTAQESTIADLYGGSALDRIKQRSRLKKMGKRNIVRKIK